MADTISITCPECDKQFQGPAGLVGKKIRCKACSAAFTVKPPAKKAPAKPAADKGKALNRPAHLRDDHEEDPTSPYQLTYMDLSPRCPHCAGEMEEDAVVCLSCGYNTQTREKKETVKVYETTAGEIFLWLLPGIACVVVLLTMIGAILFLWLGLHRVAERNPDAWWTFLDHLATQIWGSVIFGGIGYFALMFAIKRLIINNKPPEKIKLDIPRGDD